MSRPSSFLKARSTTVEMSSSSSVITSIPRGGAVVPMLQKDTAVKAFLGALGLNSISGIFTPKFHLSSYKMQTDDFSSFMASEFCGVSLNICTLLGLQLYYGMSFEKSVGWSTLPYICLQTVKLLTNAHATVNMPRKNGYLALIINTVVAIASINGHALSIPLIKLYALFSLISGVPFLFAPKEAGGNMWDLVPETNQNTLLIQWMGYGLIAHFVSLLPAFDFFVGDAYKVTGLVTGTISACLMGLFSIGKLKELQLVPVLVWIALLASITLSLL